tara:strand:+ start:328 stop:534 length:207 start_codon:yes stop_codon:yes gene_type:complete
MRMSWKDILKNQVYRNKNTGKQYELEGYDLIPEPNKTHNVAILVDDDGKKTRVEQRFLDAYFDAVGEE